LEWVSVEALAAALRWEHRVGGGGATLHVELADGRTLDGAAVRGTLNRLFVAPTSAVSLSLDAAYAAQELQAFFLSWLHSLPGPMLNPPAPQGLCGRWRPLSEWVQLAAGSGLPTAPFYRSSHEIAAPPAAGERLVPLGTPVCTVLTVDGAALGAAAPTAITAACLRLAEAVRTPLLGIDFAAGAAGPWTFAGATPSPDLRLGGTRLLDRLAAALRREC
jgi:hypothetical protein